MESDGGNSPISNIIRVKLLKQKKYGLGFLVRKRSKTPHVVVSDLVSNGTAAESGLVQVGDVILKVNDVNFENLCYEKSVEVLKSLPVGVAVVLILKGPEGYTSHLETRFSQDGSPKTIRITKPILPPEGLFGRIRKTFSASAAGRPCKTKQTQANCECHKSVTWHGDNTKPSLLNGDLQNENTSCLHQGLNEYTVSLSTTNEPSNLKQHVILSTKHSESDSLVNKNETAAHINKSVTNGNSPEILSTEKEIIYQDQIFNKSASLYSSGYKVNEMDILNASHVNCNEHMAHTRPEEMSNNKKMIDSDDNISVFKENDVLKENGEIKSNKNVTHINKSELVQRATENKLAKFDGIVQMESPGNGDVKSDINGQSLSGCKMKGEPTSHGANGVVHKINEEIVNVKKAHDMDGKLERLSTPSTKNSPAKKFVKLRHVGEERPVCTDTLHLKAIEVKQIYLDRSFIEAEIVFEVNIMNHIQCCPKF